jgi:TonB family protein
MKTTLIITTLMIALASAFAETDVIPLPAATKKQMQAQAENAAVKKQTPTKSEKVQDIKEAIALKPEMLASWVRPQYPYEARARGIQGSGVFLLSINPKTGLATRVRRLHSTGSQILDNAFTSACWFWGFKPGTPKELLVPVTFTMNGFVR